MLTENSKSMEKVKDIQSQAIQQVNMARLRLTQRLRIMKNSQERMEKISKQRIIQIKAKIAATLLHEAKNGKSENCDPNQSSKDRLKYCEDNFIEDIEKLNDCKKSSDDFCYVCCDNEFGKLHEDKKDDCFEICDKFSGVNSSEKQENGYWTFVPHANKVMKK